jgi:hypothetical protein
MNDIEDKKRSRNKEENIIKKKSEIEIKEKIYPVIGPKAVKTVSPRQSEISKICQNKSN